MLRIVVVTLFTLSLMALQPAGVMAARIKDNGPGCGLGKLAWADHKHSKNIAPQILMGTTNASFGSQTFGISFGTSGCTNDGAIMAQHKVNVFAAMNFENLSQDMAQGGGEHLVSLASLMGIPAEQQAEFFALAQENYASLIHQGARSPVAVVRALNDAMAGHPILASTSTTR